MQIFLGIVYIYNASNFLYYSYVRSYTDKRKISYIDKIILYI